MSNHNTHDAMRSTLHAPRSTRSSALLSAGIMVMASLLGLGAFLYPFFRPSVDASGMMAHASDAPLLFVLLLVLCLGAVFASLTGGQMTSKMVAVLGILTALSAVLRAVPGPAGFNAIFLLPILAGYCFGPTFGFLLGALSLLVSALIGGGVGPWLPYQMFSTGWVGMLSGWLPEFPTPALGTGDAGRLGFHGGAALRCAHEHLVLAVPGGRRGSRARAGSRA